MSKHQQIFESNQALNTLFLILQGSRIGVLLEKGSFFMANLAKHIFHNFFDVFFSRFVNIHARNTIIIDDMQYKSMFNDVCSAIFLKSFDDSYIDGK